ncbi:HPr family phosphocarrier protein [Dactylosporangium sp. NPDC005555]|uniref:HPr family phosphocarrier protein n=1 Tax=Dactylosporangium sp. NPDC005555 TaxID=3154889 RepID=UPI0033AA930A
MSANSEATVVLPADLHARPAGALVRAAAGFTSIVEIIAGERRVSARSVLGVMGLNARAGTPVVVSATGDDAVAAVAALAVMLSSFE